MRTNYFSFLELENTIPEEDEDARMKLYLRTIAVCLCGILDSQIEANSLKKTEMERNRRRHE